MVLFIEKSVVTLMVTELRMVSDKIICLKPNYKEDGWQGGRASPQDISLTS